MKVAASFQFSVSNFQFSVLNSFFLETKLKKTEKRKTKDYAAED